MRKYIFRKRVGGRLITRSLGSTATLTLQQARKMAVVLAGDLVGQKVAQELVQDNLETPTPIASTGTAGDGEHLFRSVYLPAIEARRYSAHWKNAKHAEQWVNTIETYAVNKLGDIDVKNITAEDVIDVLKPIWLKKPETASRLRARLEMIFAFCIRKGWMRHNPAAWKGNLEFDLPMVSKIKFVRHHEATHGRRAQNCPANAGAHRERPCCDGKAEASAGSKEKRLEPDRSKDRDVPF